MKLKDVRKLKRGDYVSTGARWKVRDTPYEGWGSWTGERVLNIPVKNIHGKEHTLVLYIDEPVSLTKVIGW